MDLPIFFQMLQILINSNQLIIDEHSKIRQVEDSLRKSKKVVGNGATWDRFETRAENKKGKIQKKIRILFFEFCPKFKSVLG